jgi:hypothetical protein
MKVDANLYVARHGYYSAAFVFALYGGFLLAKILVYVSGTPFSPGWSWLVALNALEACGWVYWIINRHGFRFGPVLLLLPLVCALYTTIPVGLLSANLDIFPFSEGVVRRGMFMQSFMATNFWFFWCLMFSKRKGARALEKINAWLDAVSVTGVGIWLFLFSGFTIALACLVNFYMSGAAEMVGSAIRLELMVASETGKLWLLEYCFAAWLMACAVLLNSNRARASLRFSHVLFALFVIVLFMYPYLQLGNREKVSIFLIFACLILCVKCRAKQLAVIIGICVPAMLYLGFTRGGSSVVSATMAPVSFYLNLFGEFVHPHYPLLDHISSRRDLWYGWSYLRSPAVVFPSFGLWERPLSLGYQYAQTPSGVAGMGFAYTPLGEGVANYGLAAIAIVPFYLAALGRLLASERLITPLPFLVFVSISLGINRGEFISIILQLLILVIALFAFLAVTRVNIEIHLWDSTKNR